ncbi:Adaptin N terminal region family protein [Tritrichomonas foetus]|uniref:AP-1 complex subunit gamma n=1 Tax=Tritrichomonas foetus TaxID=1144522 RepID=A0A1J4JT93_9EUKA|nr:Adaptin N terminal region family protein [Tritrichomonas foetus]|eukprot:OHT02345.1 Adaptin N terminal region family protein [Tritrichomonas foetus]
MTQTLSDFIAAIRLADSIEHERFIITSEQADMRSYIRECDPALRPRIVAKLVFLNTIGENVAYGQMEVLTLMSHELYSYKRIGYTAASVILDESSEITVLITHTILKDLESHDYRTQCLALALLSNIGSAETCRSVSTHVQKLIESNNAMVMKRAAMAAVRIVQRVPELAENFKQSVQKLLKNGSHGVVIAAINLMSHIIAKEPSLINSFQRYSSAFTKILKQLNQSRPSREFTFTIFNDPFLQIKLMKILGKLKKPSNELDEVLESIATGSEIRRNTGRSLLFQAVETIVAVANNSNLRGLAFSQVGRLFQFKESNILYSALSVFSRILYQGNEIVGRTTGDSIALQRYKTQVVRCLNHRDGSIRRRALDVVSALVNEDNVESLIPEVLDYVKLADSEFRVELVAKIFTAIQRFAPTKQWNFNTVHRILIENGAYVGSDIITSFCKMISNNPDLQAHAVALLAGSLIEETENQALIQVASFVIGEYLTVDEDGSFDLLKKIVSMPQTTSQTKGYIITTLSKLAVRLGKTKEVKAFMEELKKDNDLDVQQRAGEMSLLMDETDIISDVLAPLVTNTNESAKLVVDDAENKNDEEDLLIDIGMPTTTNNINSKSNINVSSGSNAVSNNLLESQTKGSSLNDLLSLNVSSSNAPNQAAKPAIKPPQGAIEGLRKPDYVIYFEIRKNPANPKQIALRASVFNLGTVALQNFQIKFGVPVGWFLKSQPPSDKNLEPIGGAPIFQQLMVMTQTNTPLMMKVQISYLYGTQPITETGEINPIFG